MHPQSIVRGTTLYIPVSFLDDDGTALSMTSRSAQLRLTREGSTTATYSRDTGDASEFAWTVQASGTGAWLFLPTESLTLGRYVAEVYLTDASVSPTEVHLVGGPVTYTVRLPWTGAL